MGPLCRKSWKQGLASNVCPGGPKNRHVNLEQMVKVIDLQDRLTYGQVYGISPERKGSGAYLLPRTFAAPTGGAARRRRGRISAEELAERNGEEPEEAYAGSR